MEEVALILLDLRPLCFLSGFPLYFASRSCDKNPRVASCRYLKSLRGQLKNRRKKRWIILIAAVCLLFVGYQVIGRLFPEGNKQLRIQLRESVKQMHPELANEMMSRYGIKPVNAQDFEGRADARSRDVILVHGLDDPGKAWMNLAPLLVKNGFRVWIMSYPNDQPITESSRLFFEELADLDATRNGTVSIVSHSMGGLVVREMLSNPDFAYSQAVLSGRVPKVANLIMVAPPNHGSELAQFQILSEFRDQLSNLFTGNYFWLEGILDGAGEAGLDLIPGSPFLETLNSRPHPQNLNFVVIAGVMGGWKDDDIEQFVERMQSRLPQNTHDSVAKLGDILNSMAHGLGDGLVSVDSAKLNGFPLRIVQGTHLSIIRNIREGSQRMPPAVPIIVDYLQKEF